MSLNLFTSLQQNSQIYEFLPDDVLLFEQIDNKPDEPGQKVKNLSTGKCLTFYFNF